MNRGPFPDGLYPPAASGNQPPRSFPEVTASEKPRAAHS
jgi:hypothetical protein